MTLSRQRLNRLVKQREQLERMQEQELAEARRLYAIRERTLRESEGQREATLDLGVPASGTIEPAELAASITFLGRVDREIGARRAALAHSAEDVAAERDELLNRRRDRKAMETLLGKRLSEERLAAKRAELKFIDEIASTRWVRPGDNGPGAR
ncbi:MAG: flagellar export protein FliJ [Anaerolinea sp.]|nr:flagellar export protein FliJ [Anaerolinea sp.]